MSKEKNETDLRKELRKEAIKEIGNFLIKVN